MTRRLWLWTIAVLAAAQPDAEARWKAFLEWLRAQPPNSKPSDLIQPYRAELLHQGMTASEANRELERLGHMAFTRPEGARVLWNKIYGGRDPIFVQTPNALLASAIEGRQPGAALDFGMGQGRNSVYLAMQGWHVTGFDPSDEAVRQAQANAANAGVRIEVQVTSDDRFEFGTARWDLIVMTYVRTPDEHDAERIRNALKPGGIFVYENGSDRNNQLLRLFLTLHIVRFEDLEAYPDWNPGKKIWLARLVAEKQPE
jgi:SAM-dependent methyltransferase